ncbi:MAG: uroporphyrinogen decarboxylase family protein, partial [Burkholderiales bacterium]
KRELINKSVLLALVLLISALFLDMIRQFLMPMFMAGIFSAIVSPAHRWLTAKIGGRENLASVLVIVGIVVLVLAPLSILIGVVVGQARARVGDKVALQGNFDPNALFAKPEAIEKEVAEILASFGSGSGHVFNLGHGISQFTNPDHVTALVDAVHRLSRPYHQASGA